LNLKSINKVDIVTKKNPNWLLIIRDIRYDYTDYDESKPHQHKFYQIVFFENDGGVHIIDGNEYEIKKKTIHFISPNHIHQLKIAKKSAGIVCMFKEELFFINNETKKFLDEVDFFSNWNKDPVLEVDEDQFTELKQVLELLKEEYNSHNPSKNEVMFMFLKIFLIKAARYSVNYKRETKITRGDLVEQFLGLIEENHINNYSINFYASQLNISPTYLNRIIKDVYGKNVSELINERKILEAKRILRFSSNSIKEIAYNLGFEDPSYFSRFFKKHTNSTPISYRAQKKED